MQHAGTQPAPIQRAVAEAAPARERRSRASLRLALRRSGIEPLWRLFACALAIAGDWLWLAAARARSPRGPARGPPRGVRSPRRGAADGDPRAPQGALREGGPVRREPPRPAAAVGDERARRAARSGAAAPVPGGARDRSSASSARRSTRSSPSSSPEPLGAASIAQVHRGAPPGRRARGGEGPVPVARGLARAPISRGCARPRASSRRRGGGRRPRAPLRRVRRRAARGARLRARGARRARDRGESRARSARGGAARIREPLARAAC